MLAGANRFDSLPLVSVTDWCVYSTRVLKGTSFVNRVSIVFLERIKGEDCLLRAMLIAWL